MLKRTLTERRQQIWHKVTTKPEDDVKLAQQEAMVAASEFDKISAEANLLCEVCMDMFNEYVNKPEIANHPDAGETLEAIMEQINHFYDEGMLKAHG